MFPFQEPNIDLTSSQHAEMFVPNSFLPLGEKVLLSDTASWLLGVEIYRTAINGIFTVQDFEKDQFGECIYKISNEDNLVIYVTIDDIVTI